MILHFFDNEVGLLLFALRKHAFKTENYLLQEDMENLRNSISKQFIEYMDNKKRGKT